MVEQRGIEPAAQHVEVYNNTCYGEGTCVQLPTVYGGAAGANSLIENTLSYRSAGGTTVSNSGSGNTVSNNTATVTANPTFTNGTGTFGRLSDFKPTANYSGATTVPVWLDALNVLWSGVYSLGAVKP
jgi:parallel beta-helix repeat protein